MGCRQFGACEQFRNIWRAARSISGRDEALKRFFFCGNSVFSVFSVVARLP
jgi:hypothetical protein